MTRVLAIAIGSLLACEADDPEAIDRAAGFELDEARCGKCHRDAAEQWAGSRHHGSFTNADFQRAYARESDAFCRNCHAPAVLDETMPADVAEARGVGCLDCHRDDEGDAIVSGPGRDDPAPHPVVRVADFGTRSCAACHEFAFPASSRRPPDTMMQSTMTEHRASTFADRSCADCHLRADDHGARDHSLATTRDPIALRRALAVAARRDGNDLVLVLESHEVGHAFPTGDLFRRLAVHAELRDGDETIATTTRYLGRHFAPEHRPDGSREPAFHWPTPDDRIVDAATIRLTLGSDREGEIAWWVDYERVDFRNDADPAASGIASTVRLADGRL